MLDARMFQNSGINSFLRGLCRVTSKSLFKKAKSDNNHPAAMMKATFCRDHRVAERRTRGSPRKKDREKAT